MGRQKGIVTLEGTFGGLNFYIRKGKPVVRSAGGGFSGENIKNNPKMVRVRENGSEFGMVSSFKKKFKDLLFPFFGSFADTSLHGRLMRLFQKIKVCDTVSVRGARLVGKGLATIEGKLLLQQFDFTEKGVSAFMNGNLVYNPLTYSLEVRGFDATTISFPQNSSVMEVQFGVVTLDALHLPFEIFMSTSQYFDAESLVTDFMMSPLMVPTVSDVYVAVVGIRFYEVVNGERYLLKSLNCHSVAVV